MLSIIKNYSLQSLEEKTEAEFEMSDNYCASSIVTIAKGE